MVSRPLVLQTSVSSISRLATAVPAGRAESSSSTIIFPAGLKIALSLVYHVVAPQRTVK